MRSDLLQPEPRRWLSSSVIASVEEEYVAHLRAGRYHPNTVRVYLACVAHFAKWASEADVGLILIDEAAQQQFLDAHLPFCTCRPPVRKLRHELRAAIHRKPHRCIGRSALQGDWENPSDTRRGRARAPRHRISA